MSLILNKAVNTLERLSKVWGHIVPDLCPLGQIIVFKMASVATKV